MVSVVTLIHANRYPLVRSIDSSSELSVSCDSMLPDGKCFSDNATFIEAYAQCYEAGMRLCSFEEVSLLHLCCGSGCGYDAKMIWTANTCGGYFPC